MINPAAPPKPNETIFLAAFQSFLMRRNSEGQIRLMIRFSHGHISAAILAAPRKAATADLSAVREVLAALRDVKARR